MVTTPVVKGSSIRSSLAHAPRHKKLLASLNGSEVGLCLIGTRALKAVDSVQIFSMVVVIPVREVAADKPWRGSPLPPWQHSGRIKGMSITPHSIPLRGTLHAVEALRLRDPLRSIPLRCHPHQAKSAQQSSVKH